MTTARVIKALIAGLLAYASFQVSSTGHNVSVTHTLEESCVTSECAAAAAFPPSASLFM